jgi:pyridoxine 5-phosphate synthase
VATVRQARRTTEPDPVWAAALAELGGADGITVHLREDRRHIQDRDVRILRETVTVKLNLESACVAEMIRMAIDIRPDQVCLVPERREEITTEGGLDVVGQRSSVARAIDDLRAAGIAVSLFLDPDLAQIELARKLNPSAVELHTGQYARARGTERRERIAELVRAGERVTQTGLELHAGHGLTYSNVQDVARIPGMSELNIGHSIVARAVMVGMTRAVREMKDLVSCEPRAS